MKRIEFNIPAKPDTSLQVRNNRESLIEQIVEQTTETYKKKLARLIAIRSKEMNWTEQDLHALLAKKNDPKIRSFTKIVWWSIKTKSNEHV
jgi:hypothetical protein